MVAVTFITTDGEAHRIETAEGTSIMSAAVQNGVPGIVGDCGGSLACSTCHVYVDAAFLDAVGEPDEDENDMLDGTAAERLPESRLSCQIELSAALDGLVVRTPDEQL
nr:2Fe-2S iron-sulfur cluster-binding protein [Gordonia sp. LAM0048]